MTAGSDNIVSIIIPCYNAEQYIAEAIESALSQTYPNCEIIVIDDGSTDGSLAIVQKYGDRIRWKTGPNRGGCAARNLGLEMARGEWIQFLDADDKIAPRKIELQLAALKQESAGTVAVCPVWSFDHTGLLEFRWENHWCREMAGIDFIVEMWLHGHWLNPHAWLTPMALIRERGGWLECLAAGQDIEFFGRIAAGARKVVFTPDDDVVVYYRRPRSGNVSIDRSYRASKSQIEAWNAIQKLILAERTDQEAQRAVIRYLRMIAVGVSIHSEIIDEIDQHEKRLKVRDFNFTSCSIKREVLYGILGIKKTLKFRRLVRRLRGLNP